MKSCPYCGKPVQEGDTVCTNCWKSIPKPGERIPAAKPWYARIGVVGWFVIVMLAALVVFGSMLVKQKVTSAQVRAEQTRNAPAPTTRVDTGDRFGAFEVCTKFVKQKLANPDTAKFSNQFSESKVTELQPGHWEVIAFYEVQNLAGSQAKNNFRCDVKYTGSGEYELEQLSLVE